MSLVEQIFGYGGRDPYEDNGGFPGLQFNPAPGTRQAIQDLVDDLSRAHTDLKSAEDAIAGIHDGSCWTGDAAEGFRAKTQDLPKLLHTASTSFGKACKTLADWHTELEVLQSKASAYEKRAKVARERVVRAENSPDVGLIMKDGTLYVPGLMSAEEQARHDGAVKELNTANSQLQEIISDANSLKGQHESLAGLAASHLAAAGEQAPDGPGFFDNLMDGLGELAKGVTSLAGDIGKWLQEHANAISAIGDVFGTISTVTGLVGLASLMVFPPAEAVLGPISGITSVAALILHDTARAAGGESVVSDRTLIEDMLGSASFGIGKIGSMIGDGAAVGKKLENLGRVVGGESGHMTVEDWFGDDSIFGNFIPHSKKEAAIVGGATLFGGPLGGITELGMTFKHAWEKGSEKDEA